MTARRPGSPHLGASVAAVLLTGCDPLINVYGSFFPAWVVCLLIGIGLTAVLRLVFAATGLEEGFVPVLLVYPALAFLITSLTWLVLFRG
jgi:hypothetical protein